MTLRALSLHARDVPAGARDQFERRTAEAMPAGCVLVATCHRVELYGDSAAVAATVAGEPPQGAAILDAEAAVRHIVRLAVGLESAVLAEDQILHQLRRAVQQARGNGPLPPELDRALDLALRAGRRARTWLPRRRGLAEMALSLRGGRVEWSAPLLIVGAGEMGGRAARAAAARGTPLAICSRTPERAQVLAAELGARALPFDPGPDELRRYRGILVALSGQWQLGNASRAALAASVEWLVDLSAPGAIDAALAAQLDGRLTTIDDLAAPGPTDISPRLAQRLDALVDETVAEHTSWLRRSAERQLARELAERARAAQDDELVALWRRMPDLAPAQRAEVAQMASRLAERLLRDPLEQLDDDREGRHASAARALFRL